MSTFERQIQEYHRVLQMLLYSELRELERSLAELTPAQRAFVYEALESARANGWLSTNECNMLEYLIERWSTHGLALKLAFIARIERLSAAGSWPEDVRSAYPTIDAMVRPGAGAASSQLPAD